MRLAVLGLAVVLLGFLLGGWDYAESSYATQAGWVQDQPVPFSHQHHVSDDGIDCRYCHTSVEDGPHAGLPPTHTCMTCHSQIWTGAEPLELVRQSQRTGEPIRWRRVAQLPDYVHFDHSIHVNRGVGCVECHGRVDQMPLTSRAVPLQMEFCLDCHRDPEARLRPAQLVTRMEPLGWTEEQKRAFGRLVMAQQHIDPRSLDDCGICHR